MAGAGLDDEEFERLGARLREQRGELGRMLAQGRTEPVMPAFRSFLHLCGVAFDPAPPDAAHAAMAFLRAVVGALDRQLARHRGEPVEIDRGEGDVRHPLEVVAPHRTRVATFDPGWDRVFAEWRDYVVGRPRSTVIAYDTAWSDLRRFAASNEVSTPVRVTPLLMTQFVGDMRSRGLAVSTINGRLSKAKEVYKVACGRYVLADNPTLHTLGVRESAVNKRRKKRLPFNRQDLDLIFGSSILTAGRRSRGQSREASYWIPLLMSYTGARPEEIAGLALGDLRFDPQHGWYLDIIDRPSVEDRDLFESGPASGDAEPAEVIDAAADAVPEALLGHASGDGAVTDGYGSDVPLHRMMSYFSPVRFAPIPAVSWMPPADRARRAGPAAH